MTHVRAIANSLHNKGYITIRELEEEDQWSLTRGDVKVVKKIIMEESIVEDSYLLSMCLVVTTLDL